MEFEDIRHIVDAEKVSKVQALFRGKHSRKVHVSRKQNGATVVCPFVASSTDITDKICVLAGVSKDDVLLDLGCGDGVVLINVARKTGACCVGYEIDPLLCATARRRIAEAGISCATVLEKDICAADLSIATVIYMFLVPSCITALSPILMAQAAPGAKIISYHFPLPEGDGWTPVACLDADDMVNTLNSSSRKMLYSYVVPSRHLTNENLKLIVAAPS